MIRMNRTDPAVGASDRLHDEVEDDPAYKERNIIRDILSRKDRDRSEEKALASEQSKSAKEDLEPAAVSDEEPPPPPPEEEMEQESEDKGPGAKESKRTPKKERRKVRTRFFVIMLQTLTSLFTFKRWLIFLIAASSVPIIAALILGSVMSGEEMFQSLEIQKMLMRDIFLLVTYVWTAGIVLAFSAAGTVSGFIAKEAKDHTLLILVSKPIRRIEILFGKFSAYMVNMLALEALAMVITSYLMVYLSGMDLSLWGELMMMIPYLLVFVVIMVTIFGAIPMALSASSSSPGRIMLGMAGLATFMYFGFLFIRQILGTYYEDYWLYSIDLGYHLGNIYTYLLSTFDLHPGYFFQMAMAIFSGVYDFDTMPIDEDQNIMMQMNTNDFFTQQQSIIVWVAIPLALIVIAIIRLQKRNID
ncbi:MAG TPA: hypothetical protein ENN25_01860 [Euryarchaeota archaeon]|nr:hypothetical protein [Euryarchaeota archaeon]